MPCAIASSAGPARAMRTATSRPLDPAVCVRKGRAPRQCPTPAAWQGDSVAPDSHRAGHQEPTDREERMPRWKAIAARPTRWKLRPPPATRSSASRPIASARSGPGSRHTPRSARSLPHRGPAARRRTGTRFGRSGAAATERLPAREAQWLGSATPIAGCDSRRRQARSRPLPSPPPIAAGRPATAGSGPTTATRRQRS